MASLSTQLRNKEPMFDGLDLSKVTATYPPNLDWEFVKRLCDAVAVKLLLKGIVTRENAQIAVENGVDGLIVSNHGGRSEETLRPAIESLPEVIDGVGKKTPYSSMAVFDVALMFPKLWLWVRQLSG